MNKNDKIYVAGHNGLLGSAIIRILKEKGYYNIITKTSQELDLRNSNKVNNFFKTETPDIVILAAAKVGSIQENNEFPVEFLSDNIQIEINVINSSFKNNVKNLIYISSSCIYPQNSEQPLKEEFIFKGPLETENEAYGLAKLVGLKLCEYYNKEYNLNYITVIPTNLYGINDKFDPEHSHVIPGVIKRMDDAKINKHPSIEIWGSGNVYREFLYIDDAAETIIFLLEKNFTDTIINLGTGKEITIKSLVKTIKNIIGYNGELKFNSDKPEGISHRCLDITKLKKLGWEPKTSLKRGLEITYEWYKNNNTK